ncbi:hypothetical protein SHJG_5102 [Streptomyces hygroscopicus subsp. jinggangensis 5008]|nr:hypothetical protein SHJG_5102 [Streptomyces hygroscopicus subsp. jinggangensis 5008]AGF64527.1 hypothetical protein SHJGH_4864 [Streptomyces hygroscopicus subsp. jinggangensis TL01]
MPRLPHARRAMGNGHARRRGHLLCHHQRHPRDLLRPTPWGGCPLGLYRKPANPLPVSHSIRADTRRTRRSTPRDGSARARGYGAGRLSAPVAAAPRAGGW